MSDVAPLPTQPGLAKIVPTIVFAALAGLVLWAATSVAVEHYDGYEYILTARAMWRDSEHVMPKNPAFTSLLGVIHAPAHFAGTHPNLSYYHVPLAVIALGLVVPLAASVRRMVGSADSSGLAFWAVSAMCASSAYFIQYAPFALADVMVGFILALWWWVDFRSGALDSTRGRWLRAAALALCALGRIQTMMIPIASMLYQIAVAPRDDAASPQRTCLRLRLRLRLRQAAAMIQICLAAGVVYIVAAGAFFAAAYPEISLLEGVRENLNFLRYYYLSVVSSATMPPWHQLVNLFWMLTPPGVALAIAGLAIVWTKRRTVPASIVGCLLGSACYFAFIMYMGVEGPQYLGSLLAAWVMLQCAGLAWLQRAAGPRAMTGSVMLLGAWVFVVTLGYYRQPVLHSDDNRLLCERVAAWSESKDAVFLFGFVGGLDRPPTSGPDGAATVPLHDARDNTYFSGLPQFDYFTDLRPLVVRPPYGFDRFGFPIPDNVQELAPPGMTIVVPPMRIPMPDGSVQQTLLYAIRWWPNPGAGRRCDSRVREFCVEVYEPLSSIPEKQSR